MGGIFYEEDSNVPKTFPAWQCTVCGRKWLKVFGEPRCPDDGGLIEQVQITYQQYQELLRPPPVQPPPDPATEEEPPPEGTP